MQFIFGLAQKRYYQQQSAIQFQNLINVKAGIAAVMAKEGPKYFQAVADQLAIGAGYKSKPGQKEALEMLAKKAGKNAKFIQPK